MLSGSPDLTFAMKTSFPATLLLFLFSLLTPPASSRDEGKPWPFRDATRTESALGALRLAFSNEAGFPKLPSGISLYLDADEAPDESGWIMVTIRQHNGEGSGGDPNVSPALFHFYVRESDGTIEWYDVVEDQRRPWSEFLKSLKAP